VSDDAGLVSDVVPRALDRVTGSRAIPGNRVRLLVDGPDIFAAALASIREARRWVHFENYIIRNDGTGRLFRDALLERAAAGVRVRVVTDGFGSAGTPARFWDGLRRVGAEVRVFNRFRGLDLGANLVRDHRKLVAADGLVALTGGFCIADEWAGDPGRGRQPWRETGLEVRGPAAAVLDRTFADLWSGIGPSLPPDELVSDAPSEGPTEVRVIAGVPGRDRMFRTMDLLLAGSSERFWVTDAYFMAPRRLFQALLDASRDGVDVRILVPGSSDLPWIRNLTRFGYRSLLRGGVRIYEWKGPMLHAKAVVADGRWVRIGSSNLNPSSLFGNWELDVLVDDPGLAGQVESRFRRDIDLSGEVTLRPARPARSLGRARPTVLRIDPRAPAPPAHVPGLRERRRRSLVLLWTLVGSARLLTFGPLSLAFLLTALLLFFLPRAMAAAAGLLFLWVAVAAAIHALRRTDRG
jgi:cardiolipin synthase